MDNKEKSRSWFCVLNNPQEVYQGEPNEIAEKVLEEWVTDHPTRTGAVAYCISADGLNHLHMVLEDTHMSRFSALKKTYPKAHLEPTKGNKEQAEDYINKRGKFKESGEKVTYIARYGEIKGSQGKRRDLDIIEELLYQGLTPNEILDISFHYRKYEKPIREHYFRKRYKETPVIRKIDVNWHVGQSGTGKSYEYAKLVEQHGEDNVYLVSEYDYGFDKYNGEPILFMDEYRGQLKYNQMLSILDERKSQVRCRYINCVALWTEVHITSILPPERVYEKMVSENKSLDTIDQLKRRIDFVIYHYKNDDDYKQLKLQMAAYKDYDYIIALSKDFPDWVCDVINNPEPETPLQTTL